VCVRMYECEYVCVDECMSVCLYVRVLCLIKFMFEINNNISVSKVYIILFVDIFSIFVKNVLSFDYQNDLSKIVNIRRS